MFSSNEQMIQPNQAWIIGHQSFSSTALRIVVACGSLDFDLVPSHSGPTALIHFGRQAGSPTDKDTRLIDGSHMLEWSDENGVTFKPDIIHQQFSSETDSIAGPKRSPDNSAKAD